MRSFLVCALTATLVAFGLAAGCSDLGVGQKCLNPSASTLDGGAKGTQIASPSLECRSRLCYLQQGTGGNSDKDYCTAKCTTDDDCKGALTGTQSGLCPSSFVCAIPSSVGAFACEQFCICKDDLVSGVNTDPVDGGVVCPVACQNAHKCPTGK